MERRNRTFPDVHEASEVTLELQSEVVMACNALLEKPDQQVGSDARCAWLFERAVVARISSVRKDAVQEIKIVA